MSAKVTLPAHTVPTSAHSVPQAGAKAPVGKTGPKRRAGTPIAHDDDHLDGHPERREDSSPKRSGVGKPGDEEHTASPPRALDALAAPKHRGVGTKGGQGARVGEAPIATQFKHILEAYARAPAERRSQATAVLRQFVPKMDPRRTQ
jgi:hypothetical protein